MVDKNSTPSKIKQLIKVAQCHTNYQCSMLLEDVQGITNLDIPIDIYQEGTNNCLGRISLHQAMQTYIRLSDGHQLIVEVHQANTLVGPVHIVIPNTPEAEKKVLMMNKNFPDYIGNVLKDQGLPEGFLFELVKQLCCPVMVSEINQCTWDSDTGSLTTKRDAESRKNEADLEKALWFKDAFANLGIASNGRATEKQAPPPETLFNLDGDCSIKTIHQHNEAQPSSAGCMPPKKKKGKELMDVSSEEETSKNSAPLLENQGRPRAAATVREKEYPASNDEVHGLAPGAADGG